MTMAPNARRGERIQDLVDAVLHTALEDRHAWIEKQIHALKSYGGWTDERLAEAVTVHITREQSQWPIVAQAAVELHVYGRAVARRAFTIRVQVEEQNTWLPSMPMGGRHSSSDTSSTS